MIYWIRYKLGWFPKDFMKITKALEERYSEIELRWNPLASRYYFKYNNDITLDTTSWTDCNYSVLVKGNRNFFTESEQYVLRTLILRGYTKQEKEKELKLKCEAKELRRKLSND